MAMRISNVLLLKVAIVALCLAEGSSGTPVTFIFGDSLVDVGTNNFIPESRATANFLYNGIDYPNSEPTGRFSNGFNCADRIAIWLGYKKSPPSFFSLLNESTSFKRKILNGVNFASGGSGILDTTGQQMFVVPLSDQIQQFSTVRGNITEIMGPEATALKLSQSLFLVSAGSNDMFDYQRNIMLNSTNMTTPDFLATLQSTYQNHLQNLYDFGARKFGILSIPPIGCCPYQRALGKTGDCNMELNEWAQAFFNATEAGLQSISYKAEGIKYSLGNLYDITYDIIDNPLLVGFNEVKAGCCGNGSFNGEAPCNMDARLCPDRNEYLFWDSFHPTQKASEMAARSLFGGEKKYVRPMNFSQLMWG